MRSEQGGGQPLRKLAPLGLIARVIVGASDAVRARVEVGLGRAFATRNGAGHGPADGNGDAVLTAGGHDLKVWYFQGPASQLALQLFVTPPSGSETIFSMKDDAADLSSALADLGGEATPQGIKFKLDASVLFDFNSRCSSPLRTRRS